MIEKCIVLMSFMYLYSINYSITSFCLSAYECSRHSLVNVSINDLAPLVRQKICRKMNIEQCLGSDYRKLAAHLKMTNDDISLLSQQKNATESILKWAEHNPQNIVGTLRTIFLEMNRHDCVKIIDQKLWKCMRYDLPTELSWKVILAFALDNMWRKQMRSNQAEDHSSEKCNLNAFGEIRTHLCVSIYIIYNGILTKIFGVYTRCQ